MKTTIMFISIGLLLTAINVYRLRIDVSNLQAQKNQCLELLQSNQSEND